MGRVAKLKFNASHLLFGGHKVLLAVMGSFLTFAFIMSASLTFVGNSIGDNAFIFYSVDEILVLNVFGWVVGSGEGGVCLLFG